MDVLVQSAATSYDSTLFPLLCSSIKKKGEEEEGEEEREVGVKKMMIS